MVFPSIVQGYTGEVHCDHNLKMSTIRMTYIVNIESDGIEMRIFIIIVDMRILRIFIYNYCA